MKRLIGIVSLLVLFAPALSFASVRHYHHYHRVSRVTVTAPTPSNNPAPAPTPVPQPVQNPPIVVTPPPTMSASQTCMNVGYEPLNGQYDINKEAEWLKQLKAAGTTCVRLAFYGQNSSATKVLALLAKSLGFYVQIGNDGNPTSSGYSSGVVAEAQWAQANGIDQVSIGNEADAGGANQVAFASLSCAVRKVYSGVISYDTFKGSYDPIKSWAANPGCLDRLGLNIYSDYANTMAEAQQYLAGHWYISEFNLDCDYGKCDNDSSWASGLSDILGIARKYPIKISVFALIAGGDGVATHWGILNHPAVMHVLGL